MSSFKLKTLSLVLSVLILGGFYSYGLWAWTEPTSAPPGSNAPTPINIGTSDQEKAGRLSATEFYDADDSSFYINPSGDSIISGILSLGGDLYDVTNNKKIYDSTTGKFDPSVMPYEKGDLVSDWASSSYSSGYYNVSELSEGNVVAGVNFGRGLVGTNPGQYCTPNPEGADFVLCGTTSDVDCDGVAESGTWCGEGTGLSCQNETCQPSLPSNYCETHSGAVTVPNYNGNNIFCADNLMWSTTLPALYDWCAGSLTTSGDCDANNPDYHACYACQTLSYGGFSDWRLPSKDEVNLVVNDIGICPNPDGECACLAWDPLCCWGGSWGGVSKYHYWTSSRYDNRAYTWEMERPRTNVYYTHFNYNIRCVRG